MRWCSVPCAKRACSLQLAESSGDFPSDTSPGRIGKRQGKPAQLVAPNGSRITVTLGDNTGHLLLIWGEVDLFATAENLQCEYFYAVEFLKRLFL